MQWLHLICELLRIGFSFGACPGTSVSQHMTHRWAFETEASSLGMTSWIPTFTNRLVNSCAVELLTVGDVFGPLYFLAAAAAARGVGLFLPERDLGLHGDATCIVLSFAPGATVSANIYPSATSSKNSRWERISCGRRQSH